MDYLTEPEPERFAAHEVAPGVRRIVAPNPGPMTYRGTNTYLVGGLVIDPGPDDPVHRAAILAATGGRIEAIVLTHGHRDHAAGAPALAAASGAECVGFASVPEVTRPLGDGETIGELLAIHTPGHAADHLCLARRDGVVFSGDHVMSWSSSVVVAPEGVMADYFASLRRMLERDDRLYLPGHGPPLPQPRGFVAALLAHRLAREGAVLAHLNADPVSADGLVDLVYGAIAAALRPMAARTVESHLIKLRAEGKAIAEGDKWRAAPVG